MPARILRSLLQPLPLLLLALTPTPSHGLTTSCYDLLGNALSSDYAPCNSFSSATASACCLTNRENDADICLDSGLCMSTSTGWTGFLWADGCTDASGDDDACPKLCDGIRGSDWTSANVLQCSPGTWCCRESTDSPNCCSNSSATVKATSIGSLMLASAQSTSSGNVEAGSESKGTDSSVVAIVGGVLGGLLGATWLILAVVLCKWRGLKKAQGWERTKGGGGGVFGRDGSQRTMAELEGRERRELEA